jgi:hypothetical protein
MDCLMATLKMLQAYKTPNAKLIPVPAAVTTNPFRFELCIIFLAPQTLLLQIILKISPL